MKDIYLITDDNYSHFYSFKQFATSLDEVMEMIKSSMLKSHEDCFIESMEFINDIHVQVLYQEVWDNYTYSKIYYVTKITKYELL